MLKTFANEYKTIYGCEVFASHEENDEYKFPFSLKFCEVCSISFTSNTNLAHHLFMLQCMCTQDCFIYQKDKFCTNNCKLLIVMLQLTDLSDRH